MTSSLPAVFYRIIRYDSASEDDFISQAVQCVRDVQQGHHPRRLPTTGAALHMWSGVSVFRSVAAARAMARQYPNLGNSIAVLYVVPHDPEVLIEKTGQDPDHYTTWAAPRVLLAYVESRVPV